MPSCLLVVNHHSATAFLLQLWLQRAQLAEQVMVVASITEARARLAPADGTAPLRPRLLLVDLQQIAGADGPGLFTQLPNVPVVGTHLAPVPVFLLEQVQQLPLVGLVELPLTEQSLTFLRQLCSI